MSRGRGRGRGRGKPFGGLESLLPGEPPPPPILTPPPLFPPMEKRPLELRSSATDKELLALKESLKLYMQQSPFALKAGRGKADIQRYSDRFRQLRESESDDFVHWKPDWRFFPTELRTGNARMRKRVLSGAKPSIPSRKRARSSESSREGGVGGERVGGERVLGKKVTFVEDGDRGDLDESVAKEKGGEEEGEEEGEAPVEEVYEEEVEEEDTDYNMTYFDNGEDYGGGNESDALEEGPCY